MTAHNSKTSIQQQVFNLDFDLKAETFIAGLLETNVAVDINLTDYFKRRFSNDISKIAENSEENGILEIHLSRRSFYNIFPERLFHTQNSTTALVHQMVDDYKNRKLEEEQVRKFFKPLEVEFFLHRVAIEQAENQSIQSLGTNELSELLSEFWNIDTHIPKEMAAKILKTMPLMYKIAGNLSLLQSILETIIAERVVVTEEFASIEYHIEVHDWQLGVNLATAGCSVTFLPKYIFTITDIKRPETLKDYLPNGKIISFVEFYLEHTLPFEADFEINFTMERAKTDFVLSKTIYEGRLGISATI
ncbi:hypothetical protein LCGC14_1560960 [marine sediment metagenome]|uniref:Type VI secretion, VasB, ImpH, VC_A0111 n=2 Tax=root TaxID=1 RepID=A0A831QR21_9FLAO|nr:hypothetical protein [Pricia antarctica]